MDWTLDLGNSRLKLREYTSPQTGSSSTPAEFESGSDAVLANDGELLRGLDERLGERALGGVAFSSVASAERTHEVERWLRQQTSLCVRSSDALLENATRVPEGVGTDRLFAGLGALELAPESETELLICDAGTALTVDFVQRSAGTQPGHPGDGGQRGRFVGGAIAPGPELLTEALARGGARLFEVETQSVQTPALGLETAEALASGIVHGFRGAARELVAQITREAGLESPLVLLTGGASALLEGVFDEARVVQDPWLVHRGLWSALRAERERCSNSAN